MPTHAAVVSTGIRAPLAVIQVATVKPSGREVRVRVEWTASMPQDLHQNDGGLFTTHPQVLGGSLAGTVVEVGPEVRNLTIGVEVFGWGWREQKERAHQEYATPPEYLLGKLPAGFTPAQAITLTVNFVTVFHAVTTDLSLPLPWPLPSNPNPVHAHSPILIWGGYSSVGQYALQILSHYGYRNLLTTASQSRHDYLLSLGAKQVFDYRDGDVITKILDAARSSGASDPAIPFILDCIGSASESLKPVAQIAQRGSVVAVLMPVVMRDASESVAPEYSMDAEACAEWADGVKVKNVRTHFYLQNEFFKEHLQSTIMPTLLANGAVKPNKHRIVEGNTMLERAQRAMDSLRRKDVDGDRLLWRLSET